MGEHQHYRCCWQLRIGEDITGISNNRFLEFTMGSHHVNGGSSLRPHPFGPQLTLQQDSFYKPLTPEQSELAFRNEHDFDSPEAIDFEVLIGNLRDLKAGYTSTPCSEPHTFDAYR